MDEVSDHKNHMEIVAVNDDERGGRGGDGGVEEMPVYSSPVIESVDSEEDSENVAVLHVKKRKRSASIERERSPDRRKRRRSRSRSRSAERGTEKDKCYNCGENGHFSRDCSHPRSFESKTCFICRRKGHTSKYCPQRMREMENRIRMQSMATSYPYASYGSYPSTTTSQYGASGYATGYESGFGREKNCFKCGRPGHFSKDCTDGPSTRCYNCQEQGHLARECTHPPKAPGTMNRCYTCNEEGHISKECPQKRRDCYNCGGSDHLAAVCPRPRRIERSCYSCGQTDHISRDCPSGQGQGMMQRSVGLCHVCSQPGHKAIDCPYDRRRTDSYGSSATTYDYNRATQTQYGSAIQNHHLMD